MTTYRDKLKKQIARQVQTPASTRDIAIQFHLQFKPTLKLLLELFDEGYFIREGDKWSKI